MIVYVICSTFISIAGGLSLALLLNHRFPGNHIFRIILYVPSLLVGVAIAKLFKAIFESGQNGLANVFIGFFHIPPINWLGDYNRPWMGLVAMIATLLDQQHGRFAGGRWLLSPWLPERAADWLALAPILHDFLRLASIGSSLLEIRPLTACYQPGEAPTIVLSAHTPIPQHVQVQLRSPEQKLLETFESDLLGSRFLQELKFQLPALSKPGLYTLEADFSDHQGLILHKSSGFWLWDNSLVEDCASLLLERGRDLFYCAGKPFPLFGTTYMDSRVQRKFLSHPNPARWNTDFATFQRAGINVIRTGIWTDWRELMPQAGHRS